MLLTHIRTAIVSLLLFTLLTGLLYPLAITGIATLIFPREAGGSLLRVKGRIVGSALIGQQFTGPGYFWSRPSATSPDPYNGGASMGSSLGPLNPVLLKSVSSRLQLLRSADTLNAQSVPVDLVTSSASGLDPHISMAGALFQLSRVARARNMKEAEVRKLVNRYTESKGLGFLGEPGVNVLRLNLALDGVVPDGENQ